jgi:hypothetical protein
LNAVHLHRLVERDGATAAERKRAEHEISFALGPPRILSRVITRRRAQGLFLAPRAKSLA